MQTIVDRLAAKPVPIQIPIGAEEKFIGVVDLVRMKARVWHDETLGAAFDDVEIPADLLEKAKEYHDKMVEAVSESVDELFEKYIEGTPITEAELIAAIRKATIAQKIFPVICGSSFKNKGVQNMLDAVVDYLPSPLEVPAMQGINPDNGRIGRTALERQRSVQRPDLQDHDRPVCRPALLPPGLLGRAAHRRYGLQCREGTGASASAASSRCTPTSARK